MVYVTIMGTLTHITIPDKIAIAARLSVKLLLLSIVALTNPIPLMFWTFCIVIVISEVLELITLRYVLKTPNFRQTLYSLLGVSTGIIVIFGLFSFDLLGTEYFPLLLFISCVYGLSGGLNSSITVGIVNAGFYLFALRQFTNVPLSIGVTESMLLFLFTVITGIATNLYTISENERNNIGNRLTRKQQAEELKNEFVSLAAHNLRTPLTVVKGYLQVLEEEEPQSPDYVTALERVNLKLSEFETQANRLIELADLSSDQMKFSFTIDSPEHILNILAQEYTQRAQEHSLKFDYRYAVDPQVRIKLDPEHYSAAIENLLSNAIKYNNTGSYVKLSAYNNATHVFVSVSDDGGGVPKDIGAKLFTKYARSKKHTNHKGTGLGLYLSQQIIEAHNGKIELKPHPDIAEFIASVPIFVHEQSQ
ncbi:hypothetical protein CO180_02660 [candidate division WWE3 bacterium CG_4_9_14_3_um_filter_41_6]|uniref:histidine kinase n=1 Tax=candidate division WWE3 bacterium CG_4_10_14_0_2_um_filter_41_14 TaxID=1975072 RepID=A0A2M7TFT6_UNCKA|nr:MAG: hypothetical protein COY32_05995 [candidate division WWE3 bacterium CG_4_10_14_0_2_um_filter_41_14]PJA38738.1 MAG: hypothetical protein CO180_02660 [candidate division WWE3 bacterium CG_4_9_14_3_um_filter_41_6]